MSEKGYEGKPGPLGHFCSGWTVPGNGFCKDKAFSCPLQPLTTVLLPLNYDVPDDFRNIIPILLQLQRYFSSNAGLLPTNTKGEDSRLCGRS